MSRSTKQVLGYSAVVDSDGYDGLQDAMVDALGPVGQAVLVTDDNVGPLWAGSVRAACPDIDLAVVTIEAGERHKSVQTWQDLVTRLLDVPVRRNTPVLALGGGVVGDITGFAAATTLRGLPVVQLPTSLLAMVDASIGGKTGVNHPRGKNLVGAFHQPSLVWAALPTLDTLPPQEHRAGMGEVIKSALVGDAELFQALEAGPVSREEIVARSIAVKANVVEQDVHEAGLRAILNAGHTVGHAIETALGHGVMPHGCAVAVGLVAEAAFAVRHGVCEQPDLPERIASVARKMDLPTEIPEVDPGRLRQAVTVDKKASADTLAVPLPVHLGVYQRVHLSWTEAASLLDRPQ